MMEKKPVFLSDACLKKSRRRNEVVAGAGDLLVSDGRWALVS